MSFSSPASLEDFALQAENDEKNAISAIVELANSVDAVNLFVSMFANMVLGPVGHMNEMTHGTVPAKLEILAYHLYPFFSIRQTSIITPWDTQRCTEALEKLGSSWNRVGHFRSD